MLLGSHGFTFLPSVFHQQTLGKVHTESNCPREFIPNKYVFFLCATNDLTHANCQMCVYIRNIHAGCWTCVCVFISCLTFVRTVIEQVVFQNIGALLRSTKKFIESQRYCIYFLYVLFHFDLAIVIFLFLSFWFALNFECIFCAINRNFSKMLFANTKTSSKHL